MQQRDPALGEQVSRPDGSLLASDPSCRLAKGIWVTSKCRGRGIGTGEQRQGDVTLVFTKGPMTDFPLWKTDPVGRVQTRERPRPCREKPKGSEKGRSKSRVRARGPAVGGSSLGDLGRLFSLLETSRTR